MHMSFCAVSNEMLALSSMLLYATCYLFVLGPLSSLSFSMGECLVMFCNRCIEEKVHQWLCVIPLLHVYTASGDFEYLQVNTQLESEERWAGLESLLFIRFREEQEFTK